MTVSRMLGGLAAVAALATASMTVAQDRPVAIVHGRLLTVSHGVVEDGVLVMKDGRITAIGGPRTPVPAGARIVDASGKTVYPGLFDVENTLGLVEVDAYQPAPATAAPVGTPTPAAMIADVIRPTDYIDIERYNGLTNSVVTAGLSGPLPGRSAVIDLVDDKARMVVARDAGLVINFAGRRDDAYPKTVFGIVGYVRQLLTRAEELKRSGAAPRPEDAEAAAFVGVLDGQGLIIAHVNNDTEVGDALDLAERFRLKVVLVGLTAVDTSLPRIAASGFPVVMGNLMADPAPGQRYDQILRLPARLAALGVPLSISTAPSGTLPGLGVPGGPRNLPYMAGAAAAFGLDQDQALRSITLGPAEAFGLGDQLGSLDVGKAANLAIADGDPLDVSTRVDQVFIRGEAVPMTSRQTRLRDRYAVH